MGICAWEHLSNWETGDIQEETHKEFENNQQGGAIDENLALVSKTKNTKGKVSIKKDESQGEGQYYGH